MDPHRYNRLIVSCTMGRFHPSHRYIFERELKVFHSFVRHFVFFIYHEALGLLVQIGFDITAFTPSAYQRGSLPRPSMEISS